MNALALTYRREATELRRLAADAREACERDLFSRVARVCDEQAERAERAYERALQARLRHAA
jgi:hypothetical protein